MKPERIPLFPLNIVLFPGALLPLHIFEQRYREMTARCVEEKLAFGLIYAPDGGIARIGCTANIERILKSYPDGRSDILTTGADVFSMVRLLDEKSYYEAIVEYVEDQPFAELADPSATAALLQLFAKCQRILAPDESVPSLNAQNPRLSFALASNLPLDPAQKQRLLESQDEHERRALLQDSLEQLLPKLERSAHVQNKAAGNGHGST